MLLTALLFHVNIFASDTIAVTGSKEGNALDLTGPVINYTTLIKSSCLTSRSFSAVITDVDGVNVTIGTRPRVYYKRSTDANVWNNNTNASIGWKYAEATNTTSPFNFVINYALLNGGVVNVGQTIEYFVLAQDLAAIPNISINSASFASMPASVALTGAAFPMGGTINNYNMVNAIGGYLTVGSFGDFNTLTTSGGLFNVINNVGLSANTTVEILDPLLTENNFHPLNQIQNTGCNAGTVTLLIKPGAGVTATVTGSVANNPVIRILSSNVTIDGSNNGTTSRNLTLRNTNTTSPLVILYGSTGNVPINNSTLKNTICNNGASTTASVLVCDGAVGGTGGYFTNITIQNNNIQKGNIGLLCAAVPAAGNGTMLITGNDMNSTSANQIASVGVYTEGLDGAIVSNNNIGNFDPAGINPRYGIWLANGTINTTVSGNNISGISYSGAGASTISGIYLAPVVAAGNNNITGNTISNITSSGTSTVYGIGMSTSASGGITIQKNNISNIKNTNASGYGAYGISLNSTITTANITVANNFIYDIAGAGSATTPAVRNGYGIYLGAGGGYKIYYNSVALNTNQANAAGTTSAMMINGVSIASSLDIRNNIFANTQTGGAPAATRYAIYSANLNTIFSVIDNNNYYSNGTNLGFLNIDRIALNDIQAGFGINIASLNVLPDFVSSTNLHLLPAGNCSLVGSAVPIAAVTDDIDIIQVRDPVSPDIGADEFSRTMATPIGCHTKIILATGTTYIDGSCNRIARVLPSGAVPVSGSIKVCVTSDATQQYFNGDPYVQRHYDLEPAVSNQTTTSATVTLYFTDADFVTYNSMNPFRPPLPTASGGGNSDPNRANVKITQFHGAASTSPSKPGFYPGTKILIMPVISNVYWNGSYWAVTFNVSGFSGFYVHTGNFASPLPISINYFTGAKQGNTHLLSWKVTCNSTAGTTMILERSGDSRNFTAINTITANAARCQQPFYYADTDPLTGMNYYRLKIADADGKISYSSAVALLNAIKGFDIINMAPNPVVTGNFTLNVTSARASRIELVIIDMQGRLVKRQIVSLIDGFNSLPVNVGNITSGTYIMYGIIAEDKSRLIRFVIQ